MIDHATLLEQLGPAETGRVVETFFQFAYIPEKPIEQLLIESLREDWGTDAKVLLKYLAVNLRWSIEQRRYFRRDDKLIVAAGNLETSTGTPLFLLFEKNLRPDAQPWVLRWAGSRVNSPVVPNAPAIPNAPALPHGADIVISNEHILVDNADRVPLLSKAPPVAQVCAVAGAIQWSLKRNLQVPYWYHGRMNYVVPLYLNSRESILRIPDLVAPLDVQENALLVRTVLLPHMVYDKARPAVYRHDQLPAWILQSWFEKPNFFEAERADAA